MRPLLFMYVLLLAYLIQSMAQGPETSSIPKAPWLVRTWNGIHKGKSFHEAWLTTGGNTPVCYSNMKNDGDAVAKEKSEAELKDDTAVLEDSNAYRAKRLMENELIFERSIQNGLKRLLGIPTHQEQQLAAL